MVGKAKPAASRRGLSLVEVMIAVSVLTLSILMTLGTQTQCRDLTAASRETNQAVADLQTAMETILLVQLEEIPLEDGPYAPGMPIPQYTDFHLEGQSITATYPNYEGGAVPDPLQIVLECQWMDPVGRPRTLSLSCVKTR